MRNSRALPSLTLTDFARFASNRHKPGPSTDRNPRLPRFPGCAFWRRICPVVASAIADKVQDDCSEVGSARHCGSFTCFNAAPFVPEKKTPLEAPLAQLTFP